MTEKSDMIKNFLERSLFLMTRFLSKRQIIACTYLTLLLQPGALKMIAARPHNPFYESKVPTRQNTLNADSQNSSLAKPGDDWFAILQNGKRFLPQQSAQPNINMMAHDGIIFLPEKSAFDIYLNLAMQSKITQNSKMSEADKSWPKVYIRAPLKIKDGFFYKAQTDFMKGNGIANSGPYEHLYIMDYGFHYILPDRCHNYEPNRKFSCRWHINSISIPPLEIMGPLTSYPYRTLPLVIWKDENFDYKIQRGEKRFILIVFPD
jgi:hypothetical protein